MFLIGADEIDARPAGEGVRGVSGSPWRPRRAAADVILPGAAYAEKNSSWVDTEGRLQRGELAVFPPGEAKEDWKILRALSEVLDHKVPLDTIGQVRTRMADLAAPLGRRSIGVEPAPWGQFGRAGDLDGRRSPRRSRISI